MHQTTESDFLQGGDIDEKQSSDEEYKEGDKSEISDEEAGDDKETQYGQEQEKTVESNGSSDHGKSFRWHTVSVNGREKILDLKLLEPYMKVISHGGSYVENGCYTSSVMLSQNIIFFWEFNRKTS